MHQEVEDFIESVKKKHSSFFIGSRVLEAGSYNVNGSVRKFFTDCSYIGIDIHEGADVDMIKKMSEVTWRSDVIISSEMLEHDYEWEESLKNMYRCLYPGGLLLITCAAPNRPEHGTKRTTPQDSPATTDYYRNISAEDIIKVLPDDLFSVYWIDVVRGGEDLQFYAIKK